MKNCPAMPALRKYSPVEMWLNFVRYTADRDRLTGLVLYALPNQACLCQVPQIQTPGFHQRKFAPCIDCPNQSNSNAPRHLVIRLSENNRHYLQVEKFKLLIIGHQ